jgi:hypothetical protein
MKHLKRFNESLTDDDLIDLSKVELSSQKIFVVLF